MRAHDRTCAQCGEIFCRPYGLSANQWANRWFCSKKCSGIRRELTEDQVVRLYRQGKSCNEIAALAIISGTQVARILQSHDVLRTPSERQKLSHNRPEVKQKLSAAAKGRPCKESVKEKLR